jgi:CubicO group peptidase (beta-lactamase class C family)
VLQELAKVQVIDGGKLVPKKRKITLRMLLSHTGMSHVLESTAFMVYHSYSFLTAGFGYAFFDARLNDFYAQVGLDELSGLPCEYFSQPLVNQPGEQWEYGINIDWAGVLVERVSGLRLNDYFQKHIFEPMGLKNINMFPTESMKKDLAYMHARAPGESRLVSDGVPDSSWSATVSLIPLFRSPCTSWLTHPAP